MSSDIEDSSTHGFAQASAGALLASIGLAFFWAWLLLGIYNSQPLLVEGEPGRTDVSLYKVIAMFCAALCGFILHYKSRFSYIVSFIAVIILSAFLILFVLFSALGWNLPFAATIVYWIVFGLAIIPISSLYGTYFTKSDTKDILRQIPPSALIGALIYYLATNLQDSEQAIFILVLLVVSLCIFLYLTRFTVFYLKPLRGDRATEEINSTTTIDSQKSDGVFTIPVFRDLPILSYCIVFGFSAGYMMYAIPKDVISYIILLSFALSCAVFYLIIRFSKLSYISINYSQRLILPLTSIGLLLLTTEIGVLRITACVLLITSLGFFEISNLNVLIVGGKRFNKEPINRILRGRTTVYFGYFLGWSALFLCTSLIDEPQLYLTIICFILLVITAIAVSIHPFLPDDISVDNAKVDVPLKTSTNKGAGYWHTCCTTIADKHHLTPRENEVLFLLFKGKRAKQIMEALNISEHTAKTHIYHIYQKLSVSNQQELIELIESASNLDAAKQP